METPDSRVLFASETTGVPVGLCPSEVTPEQRDPLRGHSPHCMFRCQPLPPREPVLLLRLSPRYLPRHLHLKNLALDSCRHAAPAPLSVQIVCVRSDPTLPPSALR